MKESAIKEIFKLESQNTKPRKFNQTSEIGKIEIGKIEKKGKNNRRVNIHLAI